jgi:hypothetical protein
MTDPPLTTCQVCELPVSKLISASAISFKGSGWYVTDYSNKMKPPATEEKTAKPAEPKKDGPEKPAAATSTPPATTPSGSSTGGGSTPAPASSPSS